MEPGGAYRCPRRHGQLSSSKQARLYNENQAPGARLGACAFLSFESIHLLGKERHPRSALGPRGLDPALDYQPVALAGLNESHQGLQRLGHDLLPISNAKVVDIVSNHVREAISWLH